MGSDGKRRTKDQTRIGRPLDDASGSNQGGAGGSPSLPPDINNICPPAFRVKLTVQDLSANASLVLEDTAIKLAAAPNIEVGRLTVVQSKMVQACSGLGISYEAVRIVTDKEGTRYAEISQR